jgi:hypothetical protein
MEENAVTAESQRRAQLRRLVPMLAVLTGLVLGTAACEGASANPAASTSGMTTAGSGGSGQGSGPVTRSGGSASGGSGNRSAGTFSFAFARCMRAHGVPRFPDPDGKSGQLGPGSGVDPASQAFQAAINGPCRSLAPPAWVSSGTVSGGS